MRCKCTRGSPIAPKWEWPWPATRSIYNPHLKLKNIWICLFGASCSCSWVCCCFVFSHPLFSWCTGWSRCAGVIFEANPCCRTVPYQVRNVRQSVHCRQLSNSYFHRYFFMAIIWLPGHFSFAQHTHLYYYANIHTRQIGALQQHYHGCHLYVESYLHESFALFFFQVLNFVLCFGKWPEYLVLTKLQERWTGSSDIFFYPFSFPKFSIYFLYLTSLIQLILVRSSSITVS